MVTIPEFHDPVQDILRKFWDTEAIGIADAEPEMMRELLNNVQFHDNHYEVSLPWKEGHFNLPNHFSISMNRLRHLQIKFLKNPDPLTECHRIIQEQFKRA